MKFILILFLLASIQPINSPDECDKLIRKGVEAMNNKDHVKSLEQLTRARAIAEENNWYEQSFLAINNIGANYYMMLDYGEALNNYLTAYTIAIKNLDEDHEMIVLNNIAILYSKEKEFDKAQEYFTKAYNIAKTKQSKIRIGLYSINLGIVANEKGDVKTAKVYLDEAIPLLKGEPQLLEMAEIALAENYLLRHQYNEAEGIAVRLINKPKNEQNETKLSALLILSRIYRSRGDIRLAISYAQKAMDIHSGPEEKISIYEKLAELYTLNKEYDLALLAKDSIIRGKEELNDIKNGRLFETNKVKFEIQNYREELLEKQQKIASERKTFFSILSVALLVIVLITWALRNSYIKNKQRKIIQERSQEIFNLEIEKKKIDTLILEKQFKEKETLALLEEERLKNEIENRNRQLAAKALHLTHRNELIEEIIVSLSAQPEISGNPTLKQHVQQLKAHLKNDAELESFLTHFEEVNHGFLTKLKELHPDLSSNDVRFLSYVYMNLSTKEISLLLNITPEACRKRKERISRKMILPEDADLYNYMSTF